MNKKGFTLVELLSVLLILAVIATITTPIIVNVVRSMKTKGNEVQQELYISYAKLWQSRNDNLLSDEVGSVYTLTLSRLYQDGIITTENYKNIETNETLNNACIKITTLENSYRYEFMEDCNG